VGREQGKTAFAIIAEMDKVAASLKGQLNEHLGPIGERFAAAVTGLRDATQWIVENYGTNPAAVAAGSVYYLKLMGITSGGWMMARSALIATQQLAAGQGDAAFLKAKINTARFYAEHILPQAMGLSASIVKGAQSVLSMEEAAL
jgi:hypothetical protein